MNFGKEKTSSKNMVGNIMNMCMVFWSIEAVVAK